MAIKLYVDDRVRALRESDSVWYVSNSKYSAISYRAQLDIPTAPIGEPSPPFPISPPNPPTYEWPRKGPSRKKKKIPPSKTPPPPTPNDPQNRSGIIYQIDNDSLVAVLN